MSKGRMAKRISVFALCALFVCCCIALTFSLVQLLLHRADVQPRAELCRGGRRAAHAAV